MAKRTLIVNGSPRPHGNTVALIEEMKKTLEGEVIEISAFHGNTVALIEEMKKTLEGEVIEISAFRSNIAPCVDCRGCVKTAKCVVRDDMDIIYADDYDNVVIATPVYFGTMPGAMMSLLSRFQPQHAAMFFLDIPRNISPKKAGLILTAGSRKNEDRAMPHVRCMFNMFKRRCISARCPAP